MKNELGTFRMICCAGTSYPYIMSASKFTGFVVVNPTPNATDPLFVDTSDKDDNARIEIKAGHGTLSIQKNYEQKFSAKKRIQWGYSKFCRGTGKKSLTYMLCV